MARVKFSPDSPEHATFRAFWELCQDFWEPEKTDEYWETFIKRSEQFGNMYGQFSRDLGNALREYLINKGGFEK